MARKKHIVSQADVSTKQIAKSVPIKWNIPENIISRFTNNIIVQNIDNEFKIFFFETKPPINLSNEPIEEVRADCVASVIIPAKKLPGFIEALQKQVEKYNERKNKN
ncbi:MAG: hypothetical protein H3C68_04815 [Deltaproteobacteria bacterium]|nr:hypothetical protein [Deltaproteobacteria bacterium]MBZ0220048.1 hypothetical protein [Deltaproteobacteria bacterium]